MFAKIKFELLTTGNFKEITIRLESENFSAATIEAKVFIQGYLLGSDSSAEIVTITSSRPKGEIIPISQLNKI